MNKIQLAIVGCGGMGGRHLLGLKELLDENMSNVELVAVCDLRRDNAEHRADDAERLLGRRPRVFQDMAQMVAELPDLQAVDVTTDAGSHHKVICAAFELGLHVLSEKPLGITMRACNLILEAQRRSGKLLSVAENYRRDPMLRLTKALLDAGTIGDPYMLFDVSAGSGNQIIILPWRHDKWLGGILLDAGVHNADVMQYYLGNASEVYARTAQWEPIRYKPSGSTNLSPFYQEWYAEMPDSIQATAEDTLVSIIQFESGPIGQWTSFCAGHGKGLGAHAIYGSQGSLIPGGARSGTPPRLYMDGKQEITGEALLDLVPDFHLDEITSRLFGGERLGSYQMPFPNADRKLLAIEYYEFAECLLTGKQPEVDGLMGRKAVALCYAAFESGTLNRPVTLDEIEAEQTNAYETPINEHWKI